MLDAIVAGQIDQIDVGEARPSPGDCALCADRLRCQSAPAARADRIEVRGDSVRKGLGPKPARQPASQKLNIDCHLGQLGGMRAGRLRITLNCLPLQLKYRAAQSCRLLR
jgi:hypothetical protein